MMHPSEAVYGEEGWEGRGRGTLKEVELEMVVHLVLCEGDGLVDYFDGVVLLGALLTSEENHATNERNRSRGRLGEGSEGRGGQGREEENRGGEGKEERKDRKIRPLARKLLSSRVCPLGLVHFKVDGQVGG